MSECVHLHYFMMNKNTISTVEGQQQSLIELYQLGAPVRFPLQQKILIYFRKSYSIYILKKYVMNETININKF